MPTQSIDSYLEAVSPEKREALESVRQSLHKLLPGAEECISYGLPALRLNGKVIVGFGAAAKHCAFYPWSSEIIKQFPEELAEFSTSIGAIRFQPDKPIPLALLGKLVKARTDEIAAYPPRKRK